MTVTERPAHARVAAHAGLTFAGVMGGNILGYVFYALVSRALGVEAYGAFSSLLAIVMIASAPALIAQTIVAKLATEFALQPDVLAGLVRAIDRVTIAVSLAAGAMLAALSAPIAAFLHLPDPLVVTFAAAALCGAIALPFLRGVLQGTASFKAYAFSNVAEGLGKAVFAPILGVAAGLRGALAGMAVAYVAAAAYTYVAGHPHRRGTPATFSARRVVSTSAGVALAVFSIYVLLFYDVILAKRYLDAHTAGLYGAVSLACRALFAVTAFVPIVLLPQAALTAARGERTRMLFVQALAVTIAMCAVTAAAYALAPTLVLTVIAGRSFAPGAPFLVPYVVAMSAVSIAYVVATYNIARGRMAFVVPLACVALGEIAAVVLRHRSAADLLQTIAIGHPIALVACLTSLGGRAARAAGADGRTSAA